MKDGEQTTVMRRKLVKQGPSTMTVSLPATWVKANHLAQGQEVLQRIENNMVVISAELTESAEATANIDVRDLSPLTLRPLLSAMHKKGYAEITLRNTREQLPIIHSEVGKNLLGYEVVQQLEESTIIRFVTKIDVDELPLLMRRAFLVTLALAEGVAAMQKGEELLVLEDTNNRLTNYCERIINKNIYHQKDAVFTYIIVWLLEKTADAYKDIIKSGVYNKGDSVLCHQLCKQYYEAYYKYSHKRFDDFLKELRAAIETLRKKDSPYLPILLTLEQAKASMIALHV